MTNLSESNIAKKSEENQKNKSMGNKELLVKLFDSIDDKSKGKIKIQSIYNVLQSSGIALTDPRIQDTRKALSEFNVDDEVSLDEFYYLIGSSLILFEKCLSGSLVIPDFRDFCNGIEKIYSATQNNLAGKVADYIPQLKRVSSDNYGVSLCSIDGQRASYGQSDVPFCLQSTCKPINYCIALEQHGESGVHKHVGREPSGSMFNELKLNNIGLPHNPMINAGAIMCSSLIRSDLSIADRFDYVMNVWQQLSGGQRPAFNNAVYLSEKQTADRNFALGYFMRENNGFPENTDLIDTLEFYFQCCSIEVTCDFLSVVAATLANAGICPITGIQVFKPSTVKHCLSLMYSCGMYDFSGEFAFQVGLPAKSGVSGSMMVVVPNVIGFALWSPPLDEIGNSVRCVDFCKSLIKTFNFHNYDSLHRAPNKKDPRMQKDQFKKDGAVALCWAASLGDLKQIKQMVAQGIDLNLADYDGRTAIHLASSEGHLDILHYLLLKSVNINPVDRWGRTPLDDAAIANNAEVISLLQQNGAIRSANIVS